VSPEYCFNTKAFFHSKSHEFDLYFVFSVNVVNIKENNFFNNFSKNEGLKLLNITKVCH